MSALLLLLSTALAGPPAVDFSAGTYGRVQADTNLRGGGGTPPNVAWHGPRLELDPYMELDLRWRVRTFDAADAETATFTVLITPAFSGDLFHYDGIFAEELALRNFYTQVDFEALPLSLWAGERMYRGDDIYLLDFWPLDNLNTVGGGAAYRPGDSEVALHVGMNRLWGDDWQVQEVEQVAPGRVGSEPVLVLDRQRVVSSLRLVHHLRLGGLTLRGKLYGELHTLPAGERVIDDPFQEQLTQVLPADRGTLVGVQASAWGWADQSFVHLWIRRSTGLAAYGELTIPRDGLDDQRRVERAESWMFALSGNTESDLLGVQAGTYLSSFVDADGNAVDFDDRWEWVGVVRPQVYLGDLVALGAEASHQFVRPNGLNPRSDAHDTPHVTKLSLLPAVQAGKGGFSRPRVHLVYTASWLSDDARAFYHPDDVRVGEGVQHFVGIGAEWWVNAERVITPQGR